MAVARPLGDGARSSIVASYGNTGVWGSKNRVLFRRAGG